MFPFQYISLVLPSAASIAAVVAIFWLCFIYYYHNAPNVRATKLKGPPRRNLLFGYSKELFRMDESDPLCDKWVQQYGPAFQVPALLGSSEVVLADPKAVLHYFASQTTIYRNTAVNQEFFESFVRLVISS